MNKVEELFNPLIDAFDIFLNIEEKEIGCLTKREHERFLADRNYYSQLFVEKLNGDMLHTGTYSAKMNAMWESIIAKDEDESF